VHGVLRDVYRALFEGPAAERRARAKALLPGTWRSSATRDEAALAARFPALDEIAERRWLVTLEAFLNADLDRLESEGLVPVDFEIDVERPLPGRPEGLVVAARYDRIVDGPGGAVVGDYKTGGDLHARTKVTEMLSGQKLQVALYALLERAPVELLGVGFRHVPRGGEKRDPRFARFDGFTADQSAGMVETLNVLVRLDETGRFPLRVGDHCEYCDYAPACRRHHPPTEHREALATDAAEVRDCWAKTGRTPALADVRVART
jgi:RecB family exonuclease